MAAVVNLTAARWCLPAAPSGCKTKVSGRVLIRGVVGDGVCGRAPRSTRPSFAPRRCKTWCRGVGTEDDIDDDDDDDDDGDDAVSFIPDAPPRPASLDDKRLLRDLAARESHIRALKLQRSRLAVGDFVSVEVTAKRAARHRLQHRAAALRRAMAAAAAGESFDEAASMRDALATVEKQVGDITDAITAEVERATARYDAEL